MMVKHVVRRFLHSLPNPSFLGSPNYLHNPCHHSHLLRLLSASKHLRVVLQIHAQLITSAFTFNTSVTNLLINLYSTLRKWDCSFKVFSSALNPPAILYNSMMRAYVNAEKHKEALGLYHLMLEELVPPDKYTFTFALKACTGILDPEEGSLIHQEILRHGLEHDVFIGAGLVAVYCKTGNLDVARQVFDQIPNKDAVVYNTMISGLSQGESPVEALELFRDMQMVHKIEPNFVSLLNVFPGVCRLVDVKSCKSIHGYVFRRDFPRAVFNGLIDMYCKCGRTDAGRIIFNQLRDKDDVSWGTMMAGLGNNGRFHEVLDLFSCMKRDGLKMDKVSAVSALLAAAEIGDLEKGLEIHECVVQKRIDTDVIIATSLMTMYAKCGVVEKVKEVFRGIEWRDLVAWSAAIAAFAQCGYPGEALSLFRDMQYLGLKPNAVTLVGVIPACSELSAVKLGKSLHCYAVRNYMELDISVGTALVSLYAKCDLFASALTVFNRMPSKEVVSWNALINGYAQIGDPYNAMEMFCKLRLSGLHPDSGTMVGVLPSCASFGDINLGTCIHGQVIKHGFESDGHVKNALIDMYGKCGGLSYAKFLFHEAELTTDEVSWNAMIAGYMHNARPKEAISMFRSMRLDGFLPNLVTLVTVLPAASHAAALRDGIAIHAYIIQRGFQSYTLVGNCLIDMYAKCGRLDCAEYLFRTMTYKDMVTWNVMLAAYSVHGHADHALAIFSRMQASTTEVDSVSFINILSACRHAGLVDEGRVIFQSMLENDNVEPNTEHYACMVDLLGRAGFFDETMELINKMPMEPDAGVWGALMGACRMHCNVKLGEVALQHLARLEAVNPAHYVVLSSIYSEFGRWDDAGETRLKIYGDALKKTPGCSWVEDQKGPLNFITGT